MPTVNEIFELLNKKAPVSTKMDFDNVGLLAGCGNSAVRRVLISLDITSGVIDEAERFGAELIVSHHPLFFELKTVSDRDAAGRRVLQILEKGISAICMHTNLDAAEGGVNDALAKVLGILNTVKLGSDGIGRSGEAEDEMNMETFLPIIKSRLKSAGLRYHDSGRAVKRVALVGGSGGNYLQNAIAAGCDTFITADIKYDVFLEAKEARINLIDADHFCTENVVCPVLKGWIRSSFPELDIRISEVHCQTAKFF
jgi:dinuclear metal center YbgI/SA1388 family protein